jgi:ribulose 1,5-bisphosphate synthetase/thiazole synthase
VQEPQQVVSTIPSLFTSSDVADKAEGSYDVIVCGGTLGIFIATALCARGLRVAVVERNVLKGVILASMRHQIIGMIRLVFELFLLLF